MNNIFVIFGFQVFQKPVRILVDTNCASLLEDQFLYSHVTEFHQKLPHDKKNIFLWSSTRPSSSQVKGDDPQCFSVYIEKHYRSSPLACRDARPVDIPMTFQIEDLHSNVVRIYPFNSIVISESTTSASYLNILLNMDHKELFSALLLTANYHINCKKTGGLRHTYIAISHRHLYLHDVCVSSPDH
jgi:hypothetical protein